MKRKDMICFACLVIAFLLGYNLQILLDYMSKKEGITKNDTVKVNNTDQIKANKAQVMNAILNTSENEGTLVADLIVEEKAAGIIGTSPSPSCTPSILNDSELTFCETLTDINVINAHGVEPTEWCDDTNHDAFTALFPTYNGCSISQICGACPT
jgi:hypothetical protein